MSTGRCVIITWWAYRASFGIITSPWRIKSLLHELSKSDLALFLDTFAYNILNRAVQTQTTLLNITQHHRTHLFKVAQAHYVLFSIGMYSKSISPVYCVKGRINTLFSYCSIHCSVHPGIRPRANMGINKSSGIPNRWYTAPAKKSTLTYIPLFW